MTAASACRSYIFLICCLVFPFLSFAGYNNFACKYEYDSRTHYDLSALSGIQISGKDSTGQYLYFLNLCNVATGLGNQCSSLDSMACQIYQPKGLVMPATAYPDDRSGMHIWSLLPDKGPDAGLQLVAYGDAAGCPESLPRVTSIQLLCDPTITAPPTVFSSAVVEYPACYQTMTLAHKAACPIITPPAGVAPIVVNTWPWTSATNAGYAALVQTLSPVTAVVDGCRQCQLEQCDGTVGFGGSPDEIGETTLDALVINGDTFQAGSVGDLRRVKDAVGVARAVMEYTQHTLIVGESATNFAVDMGFTEETLSTPSSVQMHTQWLQANCQPNFRQNVIPDSTTSCGPYKPNTTNSAITSTLSGRHSKPRRATLPIDRLSHDTIAMIALNANGSMAAATSTNGARNKIPGRVGDSPIIGSGAFVDSTVGGCGATGDGDVMMRFLPAKDAVMRMQAGASPTDAATASLKTIARYFPDYVGAMVCLDNQGNYGGAAKGWSFSYSVRAVTDTDARVISVTPFA